MRQIELLLPEVYRRQLQPKDWMRLEELRCGAGRPILLRYGNMERELLPELTETQVEEILMGACRQSAYAYTDTIRQGYVVLDSGHRIGICGFGVTDHGAVRTIKEPSSLNIRVARQIIGCGEGLLDDLTDSTLILGPPGSGKTTLLRDAVRLLSDRGRQFVGLADERGELSASVSGRHTLNVGSRTDVMVNVPKAEAVMMLLRTMNPTWIALDEITAPGDITAMEQAAYCGVRLLATAHGEGAEDLKRRPLYRKLMECGVFRKLVVLKRDKSYEVQEVDG